MTGLVTTITAVGPAPATASATVPEAVAGGVAGGAAAARVAAAAPRNGTPLQVSIESLTPSTIPRRGEVTVTGEITNRSHDAWTDLNAYLLTSSQPITTAAELEAATGTAEDLQVGERVTTPGLYDEIGDLAPGQSTGYRISVPTSALELGADGVYWLAVHVLGASPDGRDDVADGRARTFIPLVTDPRARTTMALVVPVKGQVSRTEEGRLRNLKGWQRLLGENGRLGRLVDLSASSASVPLTYVLDPAVLDAAQSVAADNPPLDTAPTDEEPSPSESPSAGETPTAEESAPAGGEDTGEEPEPSAAAERAADWLAVFGDQADSNTVLAVPYGDVDVAAMLRRNFGTLFDRAVELSATTLEESGIEADPVVAPPSGFLPEAALDRLGKDAPLLLSDLAAPETDASVLETQQGHEAVLANSAAAAGGPAPTPPYGALAVRQRVLAEAAVHAITGDADQPVVVSTPQLWDPGAAWPSAAFFSGLEVPWLSMADLPSAVSTTSGAERTYDGPLVYPRRQKEQELPVDNLLASEELNDTGRVFASLLARNDTVDDALAETAMLASATRARDRPRKAVQMARRASDWVHDRLERVRIDGPERPFVTMSSEQGTFAVTVVNGLDEPVTVGLRASTSTPDLDIGSPEPVTLGAGQRASIRLDVTSRNIGVHSVTLSPTTAEGRLLGSSTKYVVRSSQVGLVIWVIMGLGAAVFAIAIAARIVRRVRDRRPAGSSGPAEQDIEPPLSDVPASPAATGEPPTTETKAQDTTA